MFYRLFVLILCALNVQHQGEKCRINSRVHFGDRQPIVLRNGRLLEPTDNNGSVELDHGEAITLSCESTRDNNLLTCPNANMPVVTSQLTCSGGDIFSNSEWLSAPTDFRSFKCYEDPMHTSKRTNRTCYEGNRVIEVGYHVAGEFHPVFESCFNENTYTVIYSKYTQKPYNALYQTRVDRPYFIDSGQYGSIPVEFLYSPKQLRNAVAESVGKSVDRYVTRNEYLSRGHLAAKTDFVYAFGERATFHYVNCAAQWVGFNGGNWNTLEVDLRNHIHATGLNTVIYTGTYGVTSLLDWKESRVDIYLYTDHNNNKAIPVPLYYYKVVYEPESKRGIVFVGINNPFYSPAEYQSLVFCQDLYRTRNNNKFSWLSWHPNNATDGISFCCSIPDFVQTVRHLPPLDVQGLLFY